MEEPVGLFFPIWRLQIRLGIDYDYDDIDGDEDDNGVLDGDDLDDAIAHLYEWRLSTLNG